MKKIIVPIDFSKHSEYALEAASILAKQNGAQILALHMLEMSDSMLINSDNEQNAKAVFFLKLAEQKFENFLQKDYLKGVDIVPIVKHFKVFREVSEVAKEHSVDLIVMGSHGTSGFSEIFVGSNTEKVVRHSEIPVLVIKSKPDNMDYKKVVYASDFSEEAVKPYIKASKLLESFGSEMQLLYVNVPGERFKSTSEMENTMLNFLKTADGNLNRMNAVNYVSDVTVENGILTFAHKINADLIVIPTHGRKGLAHFFEGSISEDLANHADLPVMTFRI
ncbi:universal stress protein [Subsaxibacter sp. CAU 1640]|uniref:universal stress protein n=1 Tax=Subsaxibacter sp. CAU 1640 TaxID=2933271 RepID=UPI002002C604|nr:universal stress protein [Subsaxibacter sp. CAU 1640]MCK7589997.1 universal stress protein [Subsaxibacter sp. CAU 1640]